MYLYLRAPQFNCLFMCVHILALIWSIISCLERKKVAPNKLTNLFFWIHISKTILSQLFYLWLAFIFRTLTKNVFFIEKHILHISAKNCMKALCLWVNLRCKLMLQKYFTPSCYNFKLITLPDANLVLLLMHTIFLQMWHAWSILYVTVHFVAFVIIIILWRHIPGHGSCLNWGWCNLLLQTYQYIYALITC